MIQLKQIDGALITPKDDALLYDFMLNGKSGIFEGCEVTHLGANQLRIANGRGVICGRMFVIEEETILAELSTSGSQNGRLIIRVDLSNTETPISFVTQVGTLPALVQEDINRGGTVHELALATYTATEILIEDITPVAPEVVNIPGPHTHSASDITSTLPISKGGTGSTTAAGARTALGITPVNIGAATQAQYTATIPTEGWAGGGPYTLSITVSGLLATDKPHIGPVYSAILETRTAQREAWNLIGDAEVTAANTLTLTCDDEAPSTEIPIQIEVIR